MWGVSLDLSTTRRERKKLQTRAALEQAALRLFEEKGYEHTTVEEIAEAADVAVRTFFRYFSSKQHVLFGDVAQQRVSRMRSALEASSRDLAPLDAVRSVMDDLDLDEGEQEQIAARLRLLERDPSLVGIYLTLMHDLRQIVVSFVAGRTGLRETDPYPLLVGAACVASWDVSLVAWAADPGARSLAGVRKETFAALTAAIPDSPGRGQRSASVAR
jgi:AcrR family transcriptional regulator